MTTINIDSGASGANPTATAGPTVVNGVATTFMRSDAAPAVQKASNSQFGIVEVDGTTITATGGVISATGSGAGNVSGPGSSTNLAIATWNGTTGISLLDNPNATLTGNVSQFLNRSGNFSVPSGTGAMVQVYTYVTSGNQSSVTSTTITGGNHLMIVIKGRVSPASATVAHQIQFNGDTGGNYTYANAAMNGGFFSNATAGSSTFGQIGELPGSTADANKAGTVTIFIPYYNDTTWDKGYESLNGFAYKLATTGALTEMSGGAWNSTAAIGNFTVFPNSGNYVNGTLISAYTIT